MASRKKQPRQQQQDGEGRFTVEHMLPSPRGFTAVFVGPDSTLIYEPIAFGAVLRMSDGTQMVVSLIGGAGGWRPAETLDGFLGVSAPDPEAKYWTEIASLRGLRVAKDAEPDPSDDEDEDEDTDEDDEQD